MPAATKMMTCKLGSRVNFLKTPPVSRNSADVFERSSGVTMAPSMDQDCQRDLSWDTLGLKEPTLERAVEKETCRAATGFQSGWA
ncbi:hypothetical protein QVD17_09321 [Tagetes erecta]|uniref:Uncharacterized protein n=1 Tax=Tagetes erecta TaxID=13708 RepID=A0AAD8KZ42_TARER|nr:hypothetical protein QVD17_09321 [Tagetes erecta]